MIPRKLAQTDSQNTDIVLSSMRKSFRKVGVSVGFSGGGKIYLREGYAPLATGLWCVREGEGRCRIGVGKCVRMCMGECMS